MSKKPLLSIIIPCYNHAEFLPFCLNSILSQDFKDFEIVFVDDASTDNSLEVAKKFAEKDKRIRILQNEKNLGCIRACNVGLRNAKGKYVNVFSADDGMLKRNLSRKIKILKDHPNVSFVYSEIRCIDEEGNLLYDTTYRNMESYIDRDDFQDIMEFGNFLSPASMIVKRKDYEKVGFHNESIPVGAEWFMVLQLCRGFQSAFINEPMVYFRFHKGNLKHNPLAFEPFEKEALSIIEVNGFSEHEKRLLKANIYYCIFIGYRQNDVFLKSIKYFMKSLRHNPNCFFLHLKNKKIFNEVVWKKYRRELKQEMQK